MEELKQETTTRFGSAAEDLFHARPDGALAFPCSPAGLALVESLQKQHARFP